MRKLFFLTVIVLISSGLYAQQSETAITQKPATDTKTEVKKPVEDVLVIKQDVHDFGKIPQGKPVNTVFTVTNVGKEPLKIANVQASCGCTTPEWDKETAISPGQDSKITVGYNAAAEGPFTKLITVTYNETGSKQLTIKGEVWKTPAASAPENRSLNDLKNK
ncbi:MAG: DUF1573 domain-containing protein [Ferruginibacter sp.]